MGADTPIHEAYRKLGIFREDVQEQIRKDCRNFLEYRILENGTASLPMMDDVEIDDTAKVFLITRGGARYFSGFMYSTYEWSNNNHKQTILWNIASIMRAQRYYTTQSLHKSHGNTNCPGCLKHPARSRSPAEGKDSPLFFWHFKSDD